MIDNKPSGFVKPHGKSVRTLELEKQKEAIRKDNLKLIHRLLQIMYTPPNVDCWNDNKRGSLSRKERAFKLREIVSENLGFAKRLHTIAQQPGRYYFDLVTQKVYPCSSKGNFEGGIVDQDD